MTAQSASAVVKGRSKRDSSGLRAVLRIRPSGMEPCPLGGDDGNGRVVSHDVVCAEGGCGTVSDCESPRECRAVVEVGGDVEMVGKTVDSTCVCPVFDRHDCTTTVEEIDGGELVVTVWLTSREVLSAVIEGVREVGAHVELRSITRTGPAADGRQLHLDAGSITEKQREAIEVAFRNGYYETPRRSDLGDLAAELGVSRSAVSQRLTAAEATLVRSLHDVISGRRTAD